MYWLTAGALGAVGGLVVEVVSIWGQLAAWQADRRDYRQKDKHPLPKLTDHYVDLPADTLVAATRLALGAIAGLIFHQQVTGELAAIMVGASAPAVLLQIGTSKSFGQIPQDGDNSQTELPLHARKRKGP